MTKQDLELQRLRRREVELVGQLAVTYRLALADLKSISTANFTGSGILLRLTALGGNELITPVVIVDGLSQETIEALRADIQRSMGEKK